MASAVVQQPGSLSIPATPADHDYFDLGSHTFLVTTRSAHAQRWFDRGLMWCYGFNHEEALFCFQQAALHDPDCAMAYWGIAYALGPNYNKPWSSFEDRELQDSVERTHRAAADAKRLADRATAAERDLIEALSRRYPQHRPDPNFKVWNRTYADAMATVYEKHPDDPDVATLYADSMMNLTPWKLWDIRTGKIADKARTAEVQRVLDRALAQEGGRQHPGVLHLYIHLMEMSPTPEAALTTADHLRGLVPDAGHLHHMPTHIDILCGDYRRAVASNSDAIRADERYLARRGGLNFYTLYRAHDYHFRLYAAMLAGLSAVALDTVSRLEATTPEALLRIESPPMADYLECFLAMRVHALVRFGRWPAILALPLPHDQRLYCVTTAMTHYAKALALASTGKPDDADRERALFRSAVQLVPQSRTLFNNSALHILAIADAMLDGELEYRRGNYDVAFDHLRAAVARDDALPYDEPWGWMQPARHALGALLLERDRVEEAAAVYSADLGLDATLPRQLRHPNNVWALHGYHECLVRLGRVREARLLEPQLTVALAVADVPIKASCYCRLSVQ
ncbi:TPR domain protein [Sodiomyces alkalinus F11]|uniref:TPR domain protein n=1 Tax=Sodiomyces alkalinus (strain CBS 110278 / VKM F-3762 / F11) TaxID=1314773 RepID=A0A3N2PPD9_SODAK|nr:TPR domain protein [Sodiomyces alkalinus F11]ROT36372.1 TPR domain protein [Sodiomyces alkalinus F11]